MPEPERAGGHAAPATDAAPDLRPATRPTLYFIGVTTRDSAITRVFPRWAALLGLDAVLVGVDLPLHAPADAYRRVVDFIAADPLSRGALVTTHKLDLYAACHDRLEVGDDFAALMQEVSCLSKRDGRLVGHAKDPVTGALALDRLLGAGYFAATGADVLLLGAGGAGTALAWHLLHADRGDDHPRRLLVTDRRRDRLQAVATVTRRAGGHARLADDLDPAAEPEPAAAAVQVELRHVGGAAANDAQAATLSPGSLVVNATGLGKDAPGSPLAAAPFPDRAVAWDLNYRGELVFLDQARAAGDRGVRAEDGWTYFLHGWTQHIAEVFALDQARIADRFDELAAAAAEVRR